MPGVHAFLDIFEPIHELNHMIHLFRIMQQKRHIVLVSTSSTSMGGVADAL